MEKDLFLLIIIPALLISMVFYIDKNPIITGAVTQEQKEESNSIGTYSIMPSFKVKVDYNLDEYKNLKSAVDKIVEECKNSENMEQCFRDKTEEIKWNCEEESANILYDFTDKFKECMNLEEDGIVCTFSLDERTVDYNSKIFEIILTNENQRTKAELKYKKNDKILATEYLNLRNLFYIDDSNNRDTSTNTANSIRFVVNYQNKKPFIEQAEAKTYDKSTPTVLSKMLMFYRKDNHIKFIEAGQEGNFRAPIPANKIIELPKTKGIKFCAKSDKQIYVYDNFDNTVKLRPIIYKFAVVLD